MKYEKEYANEKKIDQSNWTPEDKDKWLNFYIGFSAWLIAKFTSDNSDYAAASPKSCAICDKGDMTEMECANCKQHDYCYYKAHDFA